MSIKRKLTAAFAAWCCATAAQAATEGQNYTVLDKPIPQLNAEKVEVLEFFGYFCVHCYRLDPVLLKHSKTFAADTYLRTEHVVWSPEMFGLARVAAAVNASGLKYQANPAVFKAVYGQKIDLGDSAVFKKWAAVQKGFDAKKLMAAYDAADNIRLAKKMQELTETYRIDGTPTVIIGGKYRVKMSGDYPADMKTVDELIAKVRGERAAVQPAKSKGASLAKSANRTQ